MSATAQIGEQERVQLLEEAHLSIVHIKGFEVPGGHLDPKISAQFKKYFSESDKNQSRTIQPIGSGVIYDSDEGFVVTAAHLFNGKKPPYTIVLADKREVSATLLASSQKHNITLMKIDASDLHAATFNTDTPKMGQSVFIVGLFEQLKSGFATEGMVSGFYTPTNSDDSQLLMMDALLPSASAGGAVFDSNGQVLGLASSIYSAYGADGVSCAIPSKNIVNAVNDILQSLNIKTK